MYVTLKSICQEAVTAYFRVLFCYLSETLMKTTKKLQTGYPLSHLRFEPGSYLLAVLVSELISFFLLNSLCAIFKKILFYSLQQNIIILLSQKNRVTAKKTVYCTVWKPELLLTQCNE
jgi:hypothetical protein